MNKNDDLLLHDAIWADIFRRQLLKDRPTNGQKSNLPTQEELEELILTLRQKLQAYQTSKTQRPHEEDFNRHC
jgi:hypothetical protein